MIDWDKERCVHAEPDANGKPCINCKGVPAYVVQAKGTTVRAPSCVPCFLELAVEEALGSKLDLGRLWMEIGLEHAGIPQDVIDKLTSILDHHDLESPGGEPMKH